MLSVVRFVCLTPLLALVALGGCATKAPPRARAEVTVAAPTRADVWQRVASAADAEQIAQIGGTWRAAVADARARGRGAELRDEARLLDPKGALERPAPSPGSYSCRLVEVGATNRRKAAFEHFKPFFCYVQAEGELLTIVKQTGSQRPAGRLWEDDEPTRLVYLGSLALGTEEQPKAYGEDSSRDMAGVVERIAPFVWRLVIPRPRSGALLGVFELTPVTDQPK